MAKDQVDVLVIGAGIVGLSVALALQARGRQVVVIDKEGVGAGASFGNAGIIQAEAVAPYAMPRDLMTLLRIGLNRGHEVRYRLRDLPSYLPFLWRYYHHSAPHRHARITSHYATLIAKGVGAHERLAARVNAGHLYRQNGWMATYRTAKSRDAAAAQAELLRQDYGIRSQVLDPSVLAGEEPHLKPGLAGAVHWTDTHSLSDPGALLDAMAAQLIDAGGAVMAGEGHSLEKRAQGWQLTVADSQQVEGAMAVIATGALAPALLRKFGCATHLGIKRGYHQHFAGQGNATLSRPVADEDGYVLAPMAAGIRLTSGAELSHPTAPANYAQLRLTESLAREIFPLGDAVTDPPWHGLRPCSADMLPSIGAVPNQPGLFAAFGHGHQGLTLGPLTGELLAELMTEGRSAIDLTPFSVGRFAR